MAIPLDYEALRIIWWLFQGALLIGFAVTGGYDLGVTMLLPYVARQDIERRVTINAIAPFWEGNQVWLLLGAGAVFAAWPPVYAAAFSGFYIAMFLVLATLILRPVGFDFRNKFADPRWRMFWDYALFAAGLVPSVVFGVAFGNLLRGVPFRIDGDKAYGLGIADDKQGVALILHTVTMLQKLNFKDYGALTVLTNGDEEISSPGWRSTITKFAADQDDGVLQEASRLEIL